MTVRGERFGRRSRLASPLLAAVALASAGCAHLEPEALPQTAGAVAWRQDSAADTAAQRRVDEILTGELDADRAAQVALLASPDLQAQFEKLGVARAQYLEAAAAPNPLIDWQRRTLADGGGARVEWGLTQNLIGLLTLPMRRAAAETELAGARSEAAREVEHLALDARSALWTLQAAERIAELRRQHAELGRLAFEVAGRYRDAGNIKAFDFEAERSLHLEARDRFDAATLEALEARLSLSRLLGVLGRDTPLRIAGRLPSLPADDPVTNGAEAAALERRLDVRAARQRAEASLQRVGIARGTRLVPALEVGVAREKEPSGERLTGPTVALELPLFDARTAQIAAGDAEARVALRELEAKVLDVRRDLRLATAALANARRRVQTWQTEVLPARLKIVDGNAREFFYMLRGPFDPMHAKQAAIEAEIESVAALRDYWLARAQLARASGDLALVRGEALAKGATP